MVDGSVEEASFTALHSLNAIYHLAKKMSRQSSDTVSGNNEQASGLKGQSVVLEDIFQVRNVR